MTALHARRCLVGVLALGAAGADRAAAFTEWRIAEIYSSADGSVQYIELFTQSDDQNQIAGQMIWINGVTAYSFTVDDQLPTSDTAGRRLLIGTEACVGLPNAPAPDVVLPSSVSFLPTDGAVMVGYGGATFHDQVTYVMNWSQSCGESLTWPGPTAGPATPERFDGTVGDVECCPCSVPLLCNPDTDLCVECLADGDCPPGFRCDPVSDRCVESAGRAAPALSPAVLGLLAVFLAALGLRHRPALAGGARGDRSP